MNYKKTNLFIVGAMKAGTTSFIEMLSKHQDIFVPPVKEPHFFINKLPKNIYEPSRYFNLENYINKEFPKELHITNIKTNEQYQKLYSLEKNKKYLVDGSTCYLHAPESAKAIYDYNPKAKIIIIERDPLQRAFSHYKMDLGLGRVNTDFNSIIKKEIINYKTNALSWNSYIGMSLYRKPKLRFKELFNDVLVVRFEDLILKKDCVSQEISDFLNICKFDKLEDIHRNRTKSLRFQKTFFLLKKSGFKDYFSKIFNYNFKQKIYKVISTDNTMPLKLEKSVEKDLIELFNKE